MESLKLVLVGLFVIVVFVSGNSFVGFLKRKRRESRTFVKVLDCLESPGFGAVKVTYGCCLDGDEAIIVQDSEGEDVIFRPISLGQYFKIEDWLRIRGWEDSESIDGSNTPIYIWNRSG
ncbi:MAG: hypothetical protein KJ592_00615 [Nanoarchaeota archaeon]|nr:hypothetical protein [Nanoarchaeota archaeon]